MPKVGFGNTNDGDSARKFFRDPETTSNIIDIDTILIGKFSIILRTLNSPYKINTTKFAEYAKEAAQRYIELYYDTNCTQSLSTWSRYNRKFLTTYWHVGGRRTRESP